MKKEKYYNIFLIIYIFILLYAPPLIKSVNTLIPLFIATLIVLLLKYKNDVINFFKNKELYKLAKILLVYFLWYFFSILLNFLIYGNLHLYNIVINLYSIGLVIICAGVCCLFIHLFAKRHNISFNKIIEYIIIAASIQGIICLLSFLLPPFKKLLINILYYLSGNELYLNKYHISRRFCGYANSLLDDFGFGSGILACLPLFYCLNGGSKKYLFFVPLLLLIIIMNSRTGLIIFALGFIIWIIELIRNKQFQNYKKLLSYFSISLCIIILLILIFKRDTASWIIDDFLSFFIRNKKGTADVLFGYNFWRLPNLFGIIFGTGYFIAGFGGLVNTLKFTSDVGYINEIWKTGILGLLIVVYFVYYIYNYLIKSDKYNYKSLYHFFLISIIVGNIKFIVFVYNPGIVIMLLFIINELMNVDNSDFTVNYDKNEFNNKKLKSKKDTLVSVVVPIYKVERYLDKCVNSIINQTYSNLEIVLVDDGSPDNCPVICDEYAKKDSRIRVIHKANGGLSDARNVGIENSEGEYICFIDSDDYVHEDYISKLLTGALNNDADICVCNFYYVNEKGKIWERKQKYAKVFSSTEALKDIFTTDQNTEIVVWNKIYKRDLFIKYNIRFPKGKIHEDNFTTYKLYDKANKVVLISDNLYYYLQRENSIMSVFDERRFDLLQAVDETKTYFKNNKVLKPYLMYYEVLMLLFLFNNMIKFNYNGKMRQEIKNIIKNKKKFILDSPLISKAKKDMIWLLCFSEKLYSLLYKMVLIIRN